MQRRTSFLGLAVVVVFGWACDGEPMPPPPEDAGPTDAGPFPPVSLAHCDYEAVPPTGGAGGTVTRGPLEAGVAERLLDVPLGASLAAYTSRAEGAGGDGFLPQPDARREYLAGSFAPAVGIETIPQIAALALRAGGETVVLLKLDLASSYQGFVHDVEANLGPAYSGKVLITASHSHSSFGNYSGHSALHVGFGRFRSTVYDAIVAQLTEAARAAIDDLRPARIGIHHDPAFDLDDRVNRDRRRANDELAGGPQDDHHLYVIRVDAADGSPMALLPVFGIHGTTQGGDNAIVTTDSIGGIERVLRESFDSPVLVAHLQGAGGDVSPAGSGGVECGGAVACANFARAESIGHHAREAILAAWEAAGEVMQGEIELEMLTRTVPLGPEASTFTIRGGALSYLEFDTRREADGIVFDAERRIVSPIDEFNAPFGAALCTADMPSIVPRAQMPGTLELRDLPYRGCMRLEAVATIFERALDLDFEEPPICETTRTTVSALRIGDWLVGTMPGELVTLLADHLRDELSPAGPDRTILVGYAQDHGGYLLRPEDWLSGGYEPTITFWGPLEGEYVAEQLGRLMALALTPAREDGNAEGVPRPGSPVIRDDVAVDVSPIPVGTVPTELPGYLLTQRLRPVTSAQPAAQVARLDSVHFTFVGSDPLAGTPRVYLQRESEVPGVFDDVRRRSGRPVLDGALVMTWTPSPILRQAGTPRAHYYTVEMQAVTPIGGSDAVGLEDRLGLPLGRYRFRVEGPSYELASSPFEVTPAPLALSAAAIGADLAITISITAPPYAFRLLDLSARSDGTLPLARRAVTVTADGGSPLALTTDAAGVVTVAGAAGARTLVVVDAYGNEATLTR
ncbi:MAG: neutral/alkaline non-lysosomal ceramidase N-terminal domain-containing protein [Sandaracinaceae bacterium]|nr:neutral/alkaline non-lysosomal ceramidase N-terminal domain-containing protein [Sandaracinaceae bacterium]